MTLRACRLLDRVSYCARMPCTATNIINERITVRDTFPFNPALKTAKNTAERWASRRGWDDKGDGYMPEQLERDNEPFTVTVTDLEHRSEGGRAYKVVDESMRRFDLREDQVLEVMKTCGILPRGAIPGQFVWDILSSQVRLVLVGAELHRSMVEGSNERRTFELAAAAGVHPTEATLQIGHVYRKKDKTLHLFLGRAKRPNTGKVQFAFVEMPVGQDRSSENVDEDFPRAGADFLRCRRRENVLYARWDTLPWRERCNYDWSEKYDAYRQPDQACETMWLYPDTVLMTSPKFEADVGEVEKEFFEEIRQNPDSRHAYCDVKGCIVDNVFRKEHREGYAGYGNVWVTFHVSKAAQKQINDEYGQMIREFHDGLVWL